MNYALVFVFAMLQNIAFTLVSRSRNRNHLIYHLVASVLSNAAWFVTFRLLVVNDMDLALFIPYMGGTTLGSELGRKLAMRIEILLGAGADHHLSRNVGR